MSSTGPAPTSRFDRARIAVSARLSGENGSVRNARSAVVIGRVLAVTFAVCFGTGLYSHLLQEPLPWMRMPTRPVNIYQITQGVHVASGLASVPLLLAKLWTVYPRLFDWPPIRSLVHLIERLLIGVLVAASLLELTIGVMNIYHWYAWPFSFKTTHYALAWIIVGALLAHIGFQLPKIKRHWFAGGSEAEETPPAPTSPPASTSLADRTFDRRQLFAAAFGAAGAIVLFTAGQSTKFLSPFNLFGPRKYGSGPQGLPVNRTAEAANVLTTARDPEWKLQVTAPGVEASFSLDELRAMPQTEATIPIACVEGWSTSANWSGVRMSDLLRTAGVDPSSRLMISSLQTRGGYATSEMGPEFAADELTLIALQLNGEVLNLDHGYPARIIAPGRPGVLQTKWISTIEVMS